MKKILPWILVAVAAVAVYLIFFRKKDAAEAETHAGTAHRQDTRITDHLTDGGTIDVQPTGNSGTAVTNNFAN